MSEAEAKLRPHSFTAFIATQNALYFIHEIPY